MIKIEYSGANYEVYKETKEVGGKPRTYEYVRSAPSVRGLVVRGKTIGLSKEFRHTLNKFDYRLPGGKVFENLPHYKDNAGKDILPLAEAQVKNELRQEAGVIANKVELLEIAPCGSYVIWDLYYFLVTDFKLGRSEQESGEVIENFKFYSFKEVKEMILSGDISESRTALVLLKYIMKNQ